jgi:uncharacterized protein
MVKIPDNIEKALSEYLRELSQDIPVKSAFLFGSYATGKWTKDSDIDVAIFSSYFANMGRIEAITFLLNRTLPYHLDIQPVAFDEKDLDQETDNPFIHEILTTGIKIA